MSLILKTNFKFMKTKFYLLLIAAMLTMFSAQSQETDKFYSTTGGEIIFSFASIDDAGSESGNIMRFSPFFNFQNLVNYDFSKNVGVFSGLNIRNVGFIYDNYTDLETGNTVKKKFRNYTLGIPVGLKLGDFENVFVYGGYEIEFPLNYKEKTFENEVKTEKFNVWFSKRVPAVYHTFLVGFQFPYGANLKFKYYLTNFHNKDFTETLSDGRQVKPYATLNSNVFYVSLSFSLFKDTDMYYKSEKIY